MNKLVILISLFFAGILTAQYITLGKVAKSVESNDKFFYKINPETDKAEYLGEIEVQGFSDNDPEVFSQIYKKAKSIGANTFSLKTEEGLDGVKAFNPDHYYINLYHSAALPKEENKVYVFSSSPREQKVRINNKQVVLQPRSYFKISLQPGEVLPISTGKFLGSKILLSYKESQPAQFFQVLSAGIRADHLGQGGLNLKSGDIILLEKSYAQFLSLIYKEQKY